MPNTNRRADVSLPVTIATRKKKARGPHVYICSLIHLCLFVAAWKTQFLSAAKFPLPTLCLIAHRYGKRKGTTYEGKWNQKD